MRSASLAAVLTVLVTFVLFHPIASAQTSNDLRAAEDRLAAALTRKDHAVLERLLAPGFVLRGTPDIARDTWIENALTLCWGERYEISDFSIATATADTAIVSLLLTTFRDPVTCDNAVVRSLLTDVWIRTDAEGWRLMLRHAAPPARGVSGQFAKAALPPPRWERSAELSLVATGGNTSTQTLGGGMAVLWRPGAWTTRTQTKYVRSVTSDAVTAESFVVEVRQSRALTPNASAFGRAEYLVDRFAGIGNRTTAEAGFGWTLLRRAPHTLEVDGGAGTTHESRLKGDDLTFASTTVTSAYKWQISPSASLGEQLTFSTDVAEPANWRGRNMLQLTLALSRLLSIRVSHEVKHVARPVPGFRPTDTIVSTALVGRF